MYRLALILLMAAAVWAEVLPRTEGGPWRLQYHFTPPQNWTNDPNGLVFYRGEYHLFYQFNPFGTKWGHMSWGHAVSTDMLHWKDLPVALAEENGIMIFSGSAVVDEGNSSGLCKPNGGDRSCLVAIYTGHTATKQTQNIAFSNDRGRTWTKYSGNPVIDLHLKDFRDPKVFWYEPDKKWVMVTALADQHKLRFFASKDLKLWTALSDFGPEGGIGGVWECPDLFELSIEGSSETRWVLVLNINPGGIAGGSGTQYFVGKFDGRRFINDNPVSAELWMDYGKDYYAAVSFYGAPRRIMLGWFSNWLYANETPESDWRGAMALPREISLVRTAAGIRVRQKPIAQLASIRMPVNPAAFVPAAGKPLLTLDEANRQLREGTANRTQFQIDVAFQRGTAKHFGLRVFTGAKNYTEIGVSVPDSYLYIDRTHSGTTSFSKSFPGRQDAPMDISQELRLNVLLDRSSVEVFANDGLATLADRVYPAPGDNGISFFADGEQPKIRSLKMWQIRSVWSDRGALPEGAQVIPVRKHR